MLVLWSGTNFHMTSGVHSQKPHSSKPSKPICLARTTSLAVFALFATPVVEYPGLAISFVPPPPPLPHFFCFGRFWSVLLAAVLLLVAFACFVVVVVVVLLYAVLLWSASSPNEMGRPRSPLYYYYYYYYYSLSDSVAQSDQLPWETSAADQRHRSWTDFIGHPPPLVSPSDWSDCTIESESGQGPLVSRSQILRMQALV